MGSPCVDSGDPNGDYAGQTDIDSETQVSGGRVDMGADEYIDGDIDGLPDWWELRYFGDVNSADPSGDPESDGYQNLIEYEISSDPTAASRTYYVDANRPHDAGDGLSWQTAKRTIQAAINTASSTDQVVVGEGVYTGPRNLDLDLFGKQLAVRSKDPADAKTIAATIINCGSESYLCRGFFFHSDEGPSSVVEGFTMINGEANEGGAILCYQSSPTIRGCGRVEKPGVSLLFCSFVMRLYSRQSFSRNWRKVYSSRYQVVYGAAVAQDRRRFVQRINLQTLPGV
jgi:hypothetical protein